MENEIGSRAWIDEQLAAGKTEEEIEAMLWDTPEVDKQRHDRRTRDEDDKSMERGY